jgi:tetratricopeptide (TPR) repeat protein
MNTPNFLLQLRNEYGVEVWPWLVRSLHHDPLIWRLLNETDAGSQLLMEASCPPEAFSPARLALSDLGWCLQPEELRELPWRPLPSEYLQQVQEASFKPTLDRLGKIGLLALAIRERHAPGNWDGLLISIEEVLGKNPDRDLVRAVLACLYGLIPEAGHFLSELLTCGLEAEAGHVLLANPMRPEELPRLVWSLITPLTLEKRWTFVRILNAAHPDLAQGLANRLANEAAVKERLSKGQDGWPYTPWLPTETTQALSELSLLADKSSVWELSQQTEQLIPTLAEAIKTTRSLQARLAAQLGIAARRTGDTTTSVEAWKQASQWMPDSVGYAAELALALHSAERTNDAQVYLNSRFSGADQPQHPRYWFVRTKIAHQAGEEENAREAITNAVKGLNPANEVDETQESTFNNEDLLWMADVAEGLGLDREVDRLVSLISDRRLCEPGALLFTARKYLHSDRPWQALKAAALGFSQAPSDPDTQAVLIASLEACELWTHALSERMARCQADNLLAEGQKSNTEIQEVQQLAHCAIRAGDYDLATQICQQGLQSEPENAVFYQLLGEAHLSLGNADLALKHFRQATDLAPTQSEPWLALAHAYQKIGQTEKAQEILRAASQVAPNAPRVHLALGKSYLADHSPTQALASLRKAAKLTAKATSRGNAKSLESFVAYSGNSDLLNQINLALGETLHSLGHHDEARHILEEAFNHTQESQRSRPELAYAYGKLLMDLGEFRQAIPALQSVVQSQPGEINPRLELSRALLQSGHNPGGEASQAKAVLESILSSTDHSERGYYEAQALMAEACETTGDYLKARDYYRQSLDAPLAEDPAWRARLSLGMGRVALALGQFETSLAAIQESAQIDPDNPLAYRHLAEAYLAAGLLQDSVQAARTALGMRPNDLEMMVWFATHIYALPGINDANQAELLNEAFSILQRALQDAPQRTDLIVRLGQWQLRNGERESAYQTFLRLVDLEMPDESSGFVEICPSVVSDFYSAAEKLQAIGDGEAAARLLERAIKIKKGTEGRIAHGGPGLAILHATLAELQRKAGVLEKALENLDQAIALRPRESTFQLEKADILVALTQPEAAIVCLDQVLSLDDEENAASQSDLSEKRSQLHFQAANILRKGGRLLAAFEHAQKALLIPNDEYRNLTAELALALLRPEKAAAILAQGEENGETHFESYELTCLRAEQALKAGYDDVAGSYLMLIPEANCQQLRSLAIQARISARRGDHTQALKDLKTALAAVKFPPEELQGTGVTEPNGEYNLASLRSVSDAALEMAQWAPAMKIIEKVRNLAPQEPLSSYQLVRALTLQAEAQRLCMALEVVQHAPGEEAISSEAFNRFESALQETRRLLDRWTGPEGRDQEIPFDELQSWQARGRAAFQPTPENAQALEALPHSPGLVAALIAILGQHGEQAAAAKAAQAYPRHPWVLFQLALVLAEEKPRLALGTIQNAEDLLVQRHYQRPHEIPLRHFLLARLAFRNHDLENALKAIQYALASRPDEPRWHAFAAEIYLSSEAKDQPESLEQAIFHLEQAVQLEPDYAPNLLALGNAYLACGDMEGATHVLQEAVRLNPEDASAWFGLARAQKATGQVEQAAFSAEKAIERSDNPVEALLLRAEVDLDTNNPHSALSRAQAALRISPQNPKAMHIAAKSLASQKKPDEALGMLEKAIPMVENNLPLLIERAHVLKDVRGSKAAQEALQDLAQLYPKDPQIHADLAEMLAENGHLAAAVDTAKIALQAKNSPLPAGTQANLHHLIGRQMRRIGQLDQAIQHLDTAVQLNPEATEIYLELGQAYQSRRQFGQALKTYQQAIQFIQGDFRPYYQAGLALKELKDYQSAENMLRKAADLAPEDVTVHRSLGAVVALNLVHNRLKSPIDQLH